MLSLLAVGLLLASSFSGQVVCSGCWSEADRTKVAYGTDADVACAKRCAGDGIGQSLAVRAPDGTFTLYELKRGKLAGGRDVFLDAIGAAVEIEGTLTTRSGKPSLEVDAMRVVTPRGAASH